MKRSSRRRCKSQQHHGLIRYIALESCATTGARTINRNQTNTNKTMYINRCGLVFGFLISCARARTVVSEVNTETQSFADCKLHIRTRLICFGFEQFLEKKLLVWRQFLVFNETYVENQDLHCRIIKNQYILWMIILELESWRTWG